MIRALDAELGVRYKDLEGELRKALKAQAELVADKRQLQIQYDSSEKQCQLFIAELDNLEEWLGKKWSGLISFNKKLQPRFLNNFHYRYSTLRFLSDK